MAAIYDDIVTSISLSPAAFPVFHVGNIRGRNAPQLFPPPIDSARSFKLFDRKEDSFRRMGRRLRTITQSFTFRDRVLLKKIFLLYFQTLIEFFFFLFRYVDLERLQEARKGAV